MGLFDSIFGKEPKATTESRSILTPEQDDLLRKLIAQLGGSDTTTTPYTKPISAGLSNLEGLSLTALENLAQQVGSPDSLMGKARGAVGDVIDSGGSPVDWEGVYRDSIRDPSIQEFRDTILPEITGRFRGTGAFSSDRMKQEILATDRLSKNLVGARSELAYKTNTDAVNRLLQASGMAPALQDADLRELTTLLAAGGVPREAENERLKADYLEYLRGETGKSERIQQILAALGQRAFENITTVTPGSSGLLGGLAQGFGSALGGSKAVSTAISSILSDRRLKRGIRRIGELAGHTIYEYRYAWGGPRQVGVMAQDVMNVPGAVSVHPSGFLTVNYAAL